MSVLAFLLIPLALYGAYRLGKSDGRFEERQHKTLVAIDWMRDFITGRITQGQFIDRCRAYFEGRK